MRSDHESGELGREETHLVDTIVEPRLAMREGAEEGADIDP